ASAADLGLEIFDDDERSLIDRVGSSRAFVVNHHVAHAASAFAVGAMPEAAVLIVDGSGTRFPKEEGEPGLIAMGAPDVPDDFPMRHYDRSAETQSIFHATRDGSGRPSYRRVATSRRSGIGHFYTFFSRHVLGFGMNQEGKSMGLAAWGDSARIDAPRFPDEVLDSIETAMLEHCMSVGYRPPKRASGIDPTTSPTADIAHWMQEVLGEAMLRLARRSLRETGSRRLCMAGGVTLNVVANRLIRDTLRGEGMLDEIFVQPAASDTGTPLGAALHGYASVLQGTCPFQSNLVYLGPDHDEEAAEGLAIESGGVRHEDPTNATADLLLDGRIVGWWQGRSEHGPRALGSRSILCWPRPDWMKGHLNARVKHREMFRPFAPIIAEERAFEVFDCDFAVPYMLMNTRVRPEYRDRLPAITHVDGSGRLQTVASSRTPRLHLLLKEIHARDGVGVLLNTSFNDAGEPIVETAAHAIDCFRRTNIDALVIGRVVIVKS
ncbi:MAG: hypothetical protein KDA28_15665, partial [Phycisphaerales bacterium]|nr:hypothetical protein [Phycisphaerales bacterium]